MEEEVKKDEVIQLHLDDIIPNRFQPREVFDERALKELAVSIREHGVIQPIIVRNVNGKYEIIAGERRYKASALAGLTKIPAIIRDLDDKESSKVALLENLQRRNLNPIEEARTYQKILEIDEMTQEELAKTMGKSQSAVANKIRLLSLPQEIQDSLLKEKISERHARALLNVPDATIQKQLMEQVETEKMSVRALEEVIKERYPKGVSASEIPIEATTLDSAANGFLDNKPLAPTVQEEEEQSSNYGKVVIAPPTENEEEGNADMNNEVNTEETTTTESNQTPESTSSNIIPSAPSSALDNLLEVKANTKPDIGAQNQGEDYFELKEIPNIKVPDAALATENNALAPTPAIVNAGPSLSVDESITKIKELIEELKNNGINITADEMDFPKSYQVIIKIDKPE